MQPLPHARDGTRRAARIAAPSSFVLVFFIVFIFFAASAWAGALQDGLVKGGILVIQGAVDRYGAGHVFVYPTADVVRKGGGTDLPLWPTNPYSGMPMAPGTGLGQYIYTQTTDGYTLVGRLSTGSFTVSGAAPPQVTANRNDATKSGLVVVQRCIEKYAENYGDRCPATIDATIRDDPYAGLKGTHWPQNPFTGGLMANGTAAGDYTYLPGAGGTSYRLVGHLSGGAQYTITGDTSATWTSKFRSWWKAEVTKNGVLRIRERIEEWAIDYYAYPPASAVAANGGVGQLFVDEDWPKNPFTNVPMVDSSALGDFTYVTFEDSYTITGHLPGGGSYTLGPSTIPGHVHLLREHLKNLWAQTGIQVIKDYVDAWAAAHSGTLPTAAQLSSSGAVGLAHGFWPRNPWTWAPMAQGTWPGDFEYTPGGGTYTLVVHQHADEWYPETYTAQ